MKYTLPDMKYTLPDIQDMTWSDPDPDPDCLKRLGVKWRSLTLPSLYLNPTLTLPPRTPTPNPTRTPSQNPTRTPSPNPNPCVNPTRTPTPTLILVLTLLVTLTLPLLHYPYYTTPVTLPLVYSEP